MERTLLEAPPIEIPPIVISYRAAAKKVGETEGNFGAFRPWFVAAEFGENKEKALEIFMDPPRDALFPDSEDFILRLRENPDLDFAIWTQGEMDADAPSTQTVKNKTGEEEMRGFQELKIEASGIKKSFNPEWGERLRQVELSTAIGGLDKTSEEFFKKILKAIEAGGYETVVLLDDKLDKLEKAAEHLKILGTDRFELIHVNRESEGERKTGEVRSLSEVSLPQGKVLVLCDFDGTLSDTKKIKADHERRLAELSI